MGKKGPGRHTEGEGARNRARVGGFERKGEAKGTGRATTVKVGDGTLALLCFVTQATPTHLNATPYARPELAPRYFAILSYR